MPTPILATKLYIPPPRPDLVPRPHLIERLNEGVHRKLTLISAPAGFGKTTLVSDWIGVTERRVAWLSLEDGDSELIRFWAYFVAAVDTIHTSFGKEVLALLESSPLPPIESILTTLLNEIALIPDAFILVLDDYHLVDSQATDEALSFLIDHLPPQMHLVITTREDPSLPLARYRGRGQLTELRAADLRFTPDEATSFLNESMGLTLTAEEVVALEARTEGWITGLQLAALSVQGRVDHGQNNVAAFIQAFTGSHHYILDYLIEEVLQHQPEHLRNFLLRTSILERLNGPLCYAVASDTVTSDTVTSDTVASDTVDSDAVTGSEQNQRDGQGLLESMEHDNLFVIPLDDQREWYRYHHLFADVLRARLSELQPELLPTLHQRASAWYAQHDLPADAIRHALAAEDFVAAAGIIELSWRTMDRSLQSATWLGWAKTLPDELVRSMPVLSVGYAWALLDAGELEASQSRLQDAERWLNATSALDNEPDTAPLDVATSGMLVVDEEEFESLAATIVSARAFHAQSLGDSAGAVKYTQQALDLIPEDDIMQRAPAAGLLGLAQWANGNLAAAYENFDHFMTAMEATGNIIFAISATHGAANLKIEQGCLREAVSIYERALALSIAHGDPLIVGTTDLYLGLSELHREFGDLDAAIEFMDKSEGLGASVALPGWPHRICLAQARMVEIAGDLNAAIELLDEAERLYHRSPMPDIRPMAALKTRVWLKQGRLNDALGWVRDRELSVDDEIDYLHEFEFITLARVLLAQHQSNQAGLKDDVMPSAMRLLTRLLQSTEASGRIGNVIEILLLQALAYETEGNSATALASLEHALTLSASQGYVRIFVDEGVPMKELLTKAIAYKLMPDHVNKLLAAFEPKEQVGDSNSSSPTTSPVASPTASSAQPLVEPLSPREIEVLHLIAQGLSNQEICDRLFLALSSVKGHNRNIFGKLQVQRRTEAVARARELGLV